jgi:hypothetical protein
MARRKQRIWFDIETEAFSESFALAQTVEVRLRLAPRTRTPWQLNEGSDDRARLTGPGSQPGERDPGKDAKARPGPLVIAHRLCGRGR